VPDVRGEAVAPGDAFLLCSDGLWGVLAVEVIAALMRAGAIGASTRALVEAAHAAGSSDNITAVRVRAHSGRMP
jgi:protein phosphatase